MTTLPERASILHTSDCHIDRLDDDLHQRAFAAAIDASIRLDVGLLLITGDLFDHGRVDDDVLAWTADELDRAGRPVVLLTGNHDVLDDRSVHHRFAAGHRCRDVHFIDDPDGTLIHVPDTDITVWGRAMVEHHPSFRPLSQPAPRVDGRWHVVAGHGLVVGGAGAAGRSSPILPEDLDALDADYVALGHVHVHQIVRTDPLGAYAGATARSLGGEPGCVLVDLDPIAGPSLTWTRLPVELRTP